VSLPQFQPLPLSRVRTPFSPADSIFEIKWDGFRALLGVSISSRWSQSETALWAS